jgi:hypothetical protein
MATYTATVEAKVLRTVTVEADNEEQALILANAEVIAELGAYSADVREMEQISGEE